MSRPLSATYANVGGHAILCKQSVPRAERPSCARLPAFPSVTPATYANVGGHASKRDTCHELATYALLRRWEASPPTNATDALLRAKMLSRPYDGANVGGHAS